MTDELTWQRYRKAVVRKLQDARHAVATRVTNGAQGLRRGCTSLWACCRTTGAERAASAWRRIQAAVRGSALPFVRRHAVALGIIAVLVLVALTLLQTLDPSLTVKDRIDFRSRLLGFLAILVGLYLTYRRVKAADRTVQVAEEGQVGRFLKQRQTPKRKIDPLSREELTLFLSTIQEHAPDYYPLFLCLARTGMRLGEALAVKWGDIDFRRHFIEVRRNYVIDEVIPPKNGETRRVDMSDRLAARSENAAPG